jgi:LuxR family transcriptional regulator, maltose regulon positive regulatory protein
MPHPMGVSTEASNSPLPGFANSVQKIIETAIEKNDLDFFYRLYLTRMAELSLTGQGEEFIQFAKSSLDDSENSLFMARGFEAIGNLIDLKFTQCINTLDKLEASTQGSEIKAWVDQISNLCRAYVNFHNGHYQVSLKQAAIAIASPVKSKTLDPMDKGRLIRLVACIGLITSDTKKINQCAEDILDIDNPDNLVVLDHAKSAIKSMQLLTQGEYKEAYDLARTTITLEEASGRVGLSAPFDCKFVVIRCLYEFSMIDEALKEMVKLGQEAKQDNLHFINYLCEVGEIRILSRIPNSDDKISAKISKLRKELLLNPDLQSMTWLVDLAEYFAKNHSYDLGRINAIIERNPEVTYLQHLGKSILGKHKQDDANQIKELPEITAFQIIRKNLLLSKVKSEGVKKQREYLKAALAKGEQVGALEVFLRQDNLTLEAIINLSTPSNSIWLESLSRLAIERIQDRNRVAKISGEQLTGREIEVLKYLMSENSISSIGQTLHISKNTMKTHLRNIYRKLDVNGRGEAANKAKQNFII